MERETGFEPATTTLATWGSTTELLPLSASGVIDSVGETASWIHSTENADDYDNRLK